MDEKKTVIKFHNVTKRYKLYKNDKQRFRAIFSKRVKHQEKLAVNDVTFDVRQGEAVALFGKNGAGKSTILKMITGVTFPTSGEINVEGRVSALLELTSGFDPEMTGRENIYLKGQLCGLPDREIREYEKDIIKFAGIGDYIDQPVRSYSSGMKARLGFAINANIKPEILIVDEALSVGDKSFRKKCLKKIKNIIATDNVTLLFVTHSTNTAQSFCNRGIVMVSGSKIFDGDIDEAIQVYEGKLDAEITEAEKKEKAAPKSEAKVEPKAETKAEKAQPVEFKRLKQRKKSKKWA